MPRDVHDLKSQIVVDKRFNELIANLKDVKLPTTPVITNGSSITDYPTQGKVRIIEKEPVYNVDYQHGIEVLNNDTVAICAYDESIASYDALAGRAVCVSHALVYQCSNDYIPVTYVTLRFFTRSTLIGEKMGNSAIITDNTERESNICIAKDKFSFLEKNCVQNSILLIDGPLIAGDGYTTFIQNLQYFRDNGILTVFFVKNSNSNMVIDNVKDLSQKYNSDMHWSNELLKPGQRTCFYEYTDLINHDNSKIFCYVKFYEDTSPVRIEFPRIIYEKYLDSIKSVIDLSYYLLLVQGDQKNPQLRPIAIAEHFARETLKVIDVNREIRKAGLVPTMNENRWGNL